MLVMVLRLLLCCLLSQGLHAQEANITHAQRTADAYTHPVPSLEASALNTFQAGRTLFSQVWTTPGSEDSQFSGLGPLYNRFSCVACHPGNGRGFAPDGPHQSMKTMLVRLSVTDAQNNHVPHPIYGDQLNEFGVPGVAGEGIADIDYIPVLVTFADGETVTLRRPNIRFSALAYGPLAPVQTSARIAPAVFGLGLLDSISDEEILQQAQRSKPAGISGRPNRVWDIAQQKTVLGKFGWKANVPNLRQQIASAFHGDLGITSSLFPQENCSAQQAACLAQTNATPELTMQQLDQIQFYLSALDVPPPLPHSAETQRGASLFKQAQCIECHTDQLKAHQQPSLALRKQRQLSPYTDLLLHDMGEGLADHRPDFAANGSEWRTPPLWGIGLAKTVHANAGFLHDGRARNLTEAILWHGGEANTARERFRHLSKEERALLLKFLESL
ncbi:di-heme oxidoreductase family protein [Methylophilus aquaticus]|uniref:Di-heme oxidoredictase family protein n=1 Tax=Methylophilus aquaticus TaxID=1971610 RepID=A0ABT9JQB5_9PROT|nr:di-heme oxidoredictase family protein [Methylophilus aquaticus]MDP8566320.1 di-heme oxidoredictase family protein [Methylophilus aquaticus]